MSPDVVAHDVRQGLPFDTGTFDAVYHSHVIEHVRSEEAVSFMRECFRVLKTGCRVRVVTPDLETLARVYLGRLEATLGNVPGAAADHRWMQLELFDQMVRCRSGGDMGRYLRNPELTNKDFVLSRIGQEAATCWEGSGGGKPRSRLRTISAHKVALLLRRARREFAVLVAGSLAGRYGRDAFREGLFRNSGEVHHWLYDRLSLAALLTKTGFVNVRQCAADESGIPDFASYNLDVAHGSTRKPDSLFMEAEKPPVPGERAADDLLAAVTTASGRRR
jgi:hypothetical protein